MAGVTRADALAAKARRALLDQTRAKASLVDQIRGVVDDPGGTAVTSSLVRALVDNAERLGLVWLLRPGTVVTGQDTGTPRVVLDGTDTPIRATTLIGRLTAGARVMVILSPPSGVHIVGMVNAAAEVVDCVHVTTNPVITAATFVVETDIPRLLLSGNVTAGELYHFHGQMIFSTSVNDTEANLLWKPDSLASSIIGRVRLARTPYAGYGTHLSWSFVWQAPTTRWYEWHTSIIRAVGTGTITLTGGNMTFSTVSRIGHSGTIRTT